ncbi:hypothetical protein N6H14_28405 [Paenibacillus sp. CC-CFT747]|nr:hypothetical protein N6H14_28405 [Paenibacillus sp. CC-CFT747]
MKLPVSLSSLYAKLILAFLVVLTPVYIISLKMNEYGELTVRKEVENSMKSRVHFYIRLLENEFTRIVHMQKEFINDRDLRKASMAFSIMSDIEFRETVYALNARLKAMMNSSVYMSDADLFLPAESRHLSAVSFYDKLPVEEYEALKTVSRHPHNPFVYWKNRLFVSFPYSDLALINEEEPIFLLSAEISQGELTEVLNRMKIDSGGGAMIMGSGGTGRSPVKMPIRRQEKRCSRCCSRIRSRRTSFALWRWVAGGTGWLTRSRRLSGSPCSCTCRRKTCSGPRRNTGSGSGCCPVSRFWWSFSSPIGFSGKFICR